MKKCYLGIIRIAIMLSLVLALCSVGTAGVYSAGSYYSFYLVPQVFNYTDSGQTLQETRSGYYNLYNLDDPIVRCHSVDNSCPFSTQYDIGFGISGQKSLFKVYVPPGTTAIGLTVMLSQPSQFIVVARLGVPPQNDYSSYAPSTEVYAGLPTDGFNITQLKSGDCVGRNSSGFLNVANDGRTNVANEADGGWLYVLLLPKQGYVTNNIYSNTIKTDSFLNWFRNVDWSTFDSAGTVTPAPTPTPGSTPTPTPEPAATPTPTPASVDLIALMVVAGALV